MINVDEKQFDSLSEDLYVVDFYADWCGPCKAVAPVLEQVEQETGVNVYKVDIDANNELANRLGIRSIPTVGVFSKGELKQAVVGAQKKEQYLAVINSVREDEA